MTREIVNAICRDFPGAEVSDPWGGGHDAWKVGGKMFACIGAMNDGVSIKTPDIETAELLIETGSAERAPYFHKSWVHLPFDGMDDDDELRFRLIRSYRIIREGLPKKVQAGLGPVPD
ncbi:MAG: MmcQ/YjbR family DNA-binding protein [Silicimonas sp.]|nr:MmcQ/YjbR family DNA-binding protein [Silicimonas sp.]RZW05286.1 MAG: MmcQ/YjbR family DNA-binding protein [Paracoccaceae bacterium]